MGTSAANITAIPFVEQASYPVRSGNCVRPLVDGEPAFRRICEAIDSARASLWVTVTFMWSAFEMPDGRGSALDVFDRAAARGIDVRLIFWRPDTETEHLGANTFWGSGKHIAQLGACAPGVRIRWDRAQPGFCQHQKSWLIDAGCDTETAFVGGINLNPYSVVSPGHRGEGHNHDVYVELTGPSTVDVHHNFVQRRNEASERFAADGMWGHGSEANLPFPVRVPTVKGNATVQIQRTIHQGRYTDSTPSPDGKSFDIAVGERSNFEQYCAAISAARRSIYLENQYLDDPEIVARLCQAVKAGIEVAVLLPAPLKSTVPPFAGLEQGTLVGDLLARGAYENLTLAGIAGLGKDGRRKPVHIHSKLMLVDDVWATVGSCNLHRFSLFGNSEMNAAFRDPESVRTLRSELLREHLDVDTLSLDDRTALRLFRRIATDNRRKLEAGDAAWQGLALNLNGGRLVGQADRTK